MTKSWQFSKMTCMWILAGPTRLSLEACLPHSFSIIGARLFSMSLTSNAKSMSFTNTCHIGRLYFTTYPECFGPAAASSSAWLGPAFLLRGVRLTLINQLRWHTSDPAKFLYSAELSFRSPSKLHILAKAHFNCCPPRSRRRHYCDSSRTAVWRRRACGWRAAIQLASPVQRILGFRLSRHVGLHASCLGQNSKEQFLINQKLSMIIIWP